MEIMTGFVAAQDGGLYSQASTRTYGFFRDEFGRYWGADIEQKTGAPCGPLSLAIQAPVVVHPPLIPPTKYLSVNPMRRELLIDWDLWEEDVNRAQQDYEMQLMDEATKRFGEMADDAIAKRHPALLRAVGPAPEPIERIRAARAGNPWVLGFDAEKPSWAEKYWPKTEREKITSFPSAAEERAQAEPVEETYPKNMGGARWKLSDGSFTAGKTPRAEAEKLEAALHTHESWGA